jgi:RimJ/RimL family protein N-acetyltransferase
MSAEPLGEPVTTVPAQPPAPVELAGRTVTLRPVRPDTDAEPLYAVSHADPAIWTYLFDGPYGDVAEMRAALAEYATAADRVFFTLVPSSADAPQGIASYLRIAPEHGSIEVGNIWFGTPLQRTTAATEAIFLLARHAFDTLGYRRLEWKCNALNARSRTAARRFGFRFEGVFKQHMVIKGRNRDTAWYAITDDRWPGVRAAFEVWLAPENFDGEGRQREALRAGDL